MLKKYGYRLGLFFAVLFSVSEAMVYDNRWLPLIKKPFLRKSEAKWQYMLQPFFMKGMTAFEDGQEETDTPLGDEMGLFELNGKYDQSHFDYALVKSKKYDQSMLRSDLRLQSKLRWDLRGLIEAQGLGFTFYTPFNQYCGFGGDFFFIREVSVLESQRNKEVLGNLSAGDEHELLLANHAMHQAVDARSFSALNVGLSDFDLYLRAGITADYRYKMRRIDTGINVGVLCPAANRINPSNPASVSAGGDGHWGMYVSVDGDFEFKEDLRLGLLLRFSKRFAKTRMGRMIFAEEPVNFGILQGPLHVSPGLTTVFTPYIEFGGLREGLGARVQYTLIHHAHDEFDQLHGRKKVLPNICVMEARTQWDMELVTASILYDFSKDKVERSMAPTVSLAWDVPVRWLLAKRVGKTHGISLTIESYIW